MFSATATAISTAPSTPTSTTLWRRTSAGTISLILSLDGGCAPRTPPLRPAPGTPHARLRAQRGVPCTPCAAFSDGGCAAEARSPPSAPIRAEA